MGLRGPLTKAGSVRDLRQGGVNTKLDKPETDLVAPSWLSDDAQVEFYSLVECLIAANVPVKKLDAHAIACTASCAASVAVWSEREKKAETFEQQIECGRQIARFSRDLQNWLASLAATPASRARLGVQSKPEEKGALAQLLDLKAAHQA